MMAYRIATNADNVEFDKTPFNGYTLGGFTAAALLKRNTLSTLQRALFVSDLSFPYFALGFDTSNNGLLSGRAGSTRTVTGGSPNSTTPWYLLCFSGNGAATPRCHLHDGTSWTHSNGSTTFGAVAFGSTHRVWLSPPSGWGGEYLKADVVCMGFKKTDSVDLTVETLTPTSFSSWQAFGFDWLIGFDAAGTRINQGGGSGGGEIARTGTSLVSDPAGWSWAPAAAPFTPQITIVG